MSRPAPDAETVGRIDLMQFWDTTEAPPDVEELMHSWREDPQFVYHRFSWESAHAFIERHFDGRTMRAFEACAVPAMQSDVFRLCWLQQNGGVYVDADQGNRGRNEHFTDTTFRGHLYFRNPRTGVVCNGLMSFFRPQDPLVIELLERALQNVERRTDKRVWNVTGPGVVSKLLADVGREDPLFEGVAIHGVVRLKHAMNFVRCDYKSSPTHWQNHEGSLYR